jgi:thiol:disulfide interchange protein
MLLFGLAFLFIPRYLLPSGSVSVGAKALIASLIMALISWVLRRYTIFITLPLAMLVYLVVAMLLRAIPQEDMQALYRAVRNKAQKRSAASFADETTIDLQTAWQYTELCVESESGILNWQTVQNLSHQEDTNGSHREA